MTKKTCGKCSFYSMGICCSGLPIWSIRAMTTDSYTKAAKCDPSDERAEKCMKYMDAYETFEVDPSTPEGTEGKLASVMLFITDVVEAAIGGPVEDINVKIKLHSNVRYNLKDKSKFETDINLS